MGCTASGNLVVCSPTRATARRVVLCPTCGTRRRVVVSLFVWYSSLWTCCTCGESWSDGEILPRPFRRGWRTDEARRARREWNQATTWADATAAMRAEIDAYINDREVAS